jgi:hypothetical protein
VPIGPEWVYPECDGKTTWPLRRRKRPAVADVTRGDEDLFLSTMTPNSKALHDLASTNNSDKPSISEVKKVMSVQEAAEAISPSSLHSPAKRVAVFANRPQTPPTPQQTTPLPVELPGSILLPSQGFPQQDPPVTPARDKFRGRPSDESERSSTPSLDFSSSTTDGEMDLFKNFTSPQKRSGRANTLSRAPVNRTSKPFTAMSAEELMECLPELNMSVVNHSWVPAMEKELKRIKALLQNAAEAQLQSQADLGSFGMVIISSPPEITTNFC